MRIIHLLLACLIGAPALAGDAVAEAYNAEKTRIADAYKQAVAECKEQRGPQHKQCKKTADRARQDSLKMASRERDAALKCRNSCGLVTEVKQQERDGDSTGVGVVGGGVAGAVIGRQMAGNDASSSTKNVATAIGAVGGALLGKKIEEKARRHKVWQVSFRLYNGEVAHAEFNEDPGMQPGDKVAVKDGKLMKR